MAALAAIVFKRDRKLVFFSTSCEAVFIVVVVSIRIVRGSPVDIVERIIWYIGDMRAYMELSSEGSNLGAVSC